MKTRTCDVPSSYARVDLEVDGILFRGAALHGAGGIMGDASRDGWCDIPSRVVRMGAHGETLRFYARIATDGGGREFHDVPASTVKVRALYAPGYCALVNRRADQ